MNTIGDFSGHHPFVLLGSFWLFSNLVSTMPSPKSGGWTDGLGYGWLFNALHALSGTIGRVMAQYPATAKFTGQQVDEAKKDDAPKP